MEWHINDLSLDGKFSDSNTFLDLLEALLKLRSQHPLFGKNLYCSREISNRNITINQSFREAVLQKNNKDFTRLVLTWVDRAGPFWSDQRQQNPDDYFEYDSQDVAEQGLGEAARRKLVGIEANTFSFISKSSCFKIKLLRVQQGLAEAPICFIDVDNYWDLSQIPNLVKSLTIYSSWHDIYIDSKENFKNLIFSDFSILMGKLKPIPFGQGVAGRIVELLKVLNTLVEESYENSSLSVHGQEILNNHFVGEKAWFTDESATNKITFKKQMTFSDPEDPSRQIFCPWHGKIKTPQIRIHFQWPREDGARKIKVAYIGPKITKS